MECDEYVVDLNADCKCGCMSSNRFHKIYKFPNGYGASVVNSPKTCDCSPEGFVAMLLRFTSDDEYIIEAVPGFDSTTVDCASWNEVVSCLKKIKSVHFS